MNMTSLAEKNELLRLLRAYYSSSSAVTKCNIIDLLKYYADVQFEVLVFHNHLLLYFPSKYCIVFVCILYLENTEYVHDIIWSYPLLHFILYRAMMSFPDVSK